MTCLGVQTTHWQIVQTSLNATKPYQVVFEVRKGNGTSGGGFSLDDINLSETECPQFTAQLNNFEKLLDDTFNGSSIRGPRLYSKGGYSYRFGIILYKTFFALYVQLLSGKYDDELEWPCQRRQMTLQMLDQHPNVQAQMSKERRFTSDLRTFNNGTFLMNMRKCEVSSLQLTFWLFTFNVLFTFRVQVPTFGTILGRLEHHSRKRIIRSVMRGPG